MKRAPRTASIRYAAPFNTLNEPNASPTYNRLKYCKFAVHLRNIYFISNDVSTVLIFIRNSLYYHFHCITNIIRTKSVQPDLFFILLFHFQHKNTICFFTAIFICILTSGIFVLHFIYIALYFSQCPVAKRRTLPNVFWYV